MRAAATVGGNLALARNRRLESDLAPLLLAAGARVALASADGLRCACTGTYARVAKVGCGRRMGVPLRCTGALPLQAAQTLGCTSETLGCTPGWVIESYARTSALAFRHSVTQINPNATTSQYCCTNHAGLGFREMSMEELLDAHTALELGINDIVVSVTLPAARSGDVFWSHRVSSKALIRLLLAHASS